MSENLLSLLGDKNFEKLTFVANEPVNMVIEEVIEKPKGLSFKMAILDGEHATKKHFIYSNYYMETKKGVKLLNPTLSMFVRAFLQEEVKNKKPASTALDDRLSAIIDCVFENIDEKLIGKQVSIVFKPVNGEWQNIKTIEAVSEVVVKSDKEVSFD